MGFGRFSLSRVAVRRMAELQGWPFGSPLTFYEDVVLKHYENLGGKMKKQPKKIRVCLYGMAISGMALAWLLLVIWRLYER